MLTSARCRQSRTNSSQPLAHLIERSHWIRLKPTSLTSRSPGGDGSISRRCSTTSRATSSHRLVGGGADADKRTEIGCAAARKVDAVLFTDLERGEGARSALLSRGGAVGSGRVGVGGFAGARGTRSDLRGGRVLQNPDNRDTKTQQRKKASDRP